MKHLTILSLTILFFAGCGLPDLDIWETLTIKEGTHRAKPYRLTWHDNTMEAYEWRFDETALYDLGDADQCDWNKLNIVSFKKLTNTECAIMGSWRWDLSGKLLIAPYYHDNGQTFWASAPCTPTSTGSGVDGEIGYIEAEIGDVIETHVNINPDDNWAAITIINQATGDTTYFEHYFSCDVSRHRDGGPWFGGNRDAPHDIYIERKLIGIE